jgi:hypothetical protein
MHTSLLLLLLALGPQDALEAEIRQTQQDLRALTNEVGSVATAVEELRQGQAELAIPACSADLRWISGGEAREVPAGDSVMLRLNLFGVVSAPSSCLPAPLQLTATYLDSSGNLVCTGTVSGVVRQNSPTANIYLVVRPWNLTQFVSWENGPPATRGRPDFLRCLNPDGLAEVPAANLERVRSLRIWLTLMPPRGGLATLELPIELAR